MFCAGGTVFSDPIPHEFDGNVPITLGVERSEDPSLEKLIEARMNVALTVYYILPDQKEFRIAVTDLSGKPIEVLVVRWWAFKV